MDKDPEDQGCLWGPLLTCSTWGAWKPPPVPADAWCLPGAHESAQCVCVCVRCVVWMCVCVRVCVRVCGASVWTL